MKAGQDFSLNIPVSGEPPPEITWTFDGAPVENDDRMKVNNEEYKVIFLYITFLTSRKSRALVKTI